MKDFLRRMGNKMRYFMQGRYGTDKLNMAVLVAGFVLCILAMIIRAPLVSMALTVLSYVLMGWAVSRTFSRNTYKRYQENRKFLLFVDRLKDRKHRYFTCPRCRQSVRVPRGKGKIAIKCPKCGEKFIKKT